jgi:hypothetical protein
MFLDEPCDSNRGPLDPESPLLVAEEKDATDWTPYNSYVAFELADFIYRCNQMSAGDFNVLCKLWEAMLQPHDITLPFSSYSELCQIIDEMPIRGVV